MHKYRPLKDFLDRHRVAVLTLTFPELERILGFLLPASAAHPWWWAVVEKAGRPTAWSAAGFQACLDNRSQKVTFHRNGTGHDGEAI